MKKIKELYPYIIIIVVVILIRTFLFTPIIVNGSSMSPTLKGNEIMILNKISLKTTPLKRYDIVVLKDHNSYLIKRVIGLPGETIKSVDDQIYINNKVLDDRFGKGVTGDFEEIKIPDNMYYVLGDNRLVSNDSRSFGPIKMDELTGRTNLVIYPFNKIGLIK